MRALRSSVEIADKAGIQRNLAEMQTLMHFKQLHEKSLFFKETAHDCDESPSSDDDVHVVDHHLKGRACICNHESHNNIICGSGVYYL